MAHLRRHEPPQARLLLERYLTPVFAIILVMRLVRTPLPDRELVDRYGLDMRTPLLTISCALRCTRCGDRKGHAMLEPHGYGQR